MTTAESIPSKRTALKQATRAGWLILSRTLALTAFGLLLNWGLFAAMGLNVWSRFCAVGHFAPHSSSGAAAAMAVGIIAIVCSRAVILTAVFLFVFPFLYFLVGKTRGIKSAVASLTSDNREWIHGMVKPVLALSLEKFRAGSDAGSETVQETPGSATGSKRSQAKAMAAFMSKRLDQTEGLPRPLRWLVKSILKKLKVAVLIEEMNALKKNGSSDEAVTAQIRARIDREIDERMKIGWESAGMLFLVNAMFAGAVYWLVRG